MGIQGVALRTTFIVGFPGETDEQFDELLEFIAATRFERLGVFTYSQEDHTPAGNMAGQVPARVRKQRHRRAMALQQKVSRELHEALIGCTVRVLVEKPAEDGWLGRSQADAPEIDGSIHVRGAVQMGTFATVKITGAAEYDCIGDASEPALAH